MIYPQTFYEEGAIQMDLERAIPRGRRGLQKCREHRIARIVHQNIDAAKRLDGAPHQALNLRGRLLGSSSIDICHHNARARHNAVARPIPRALPVIIATWSVSCITLPRCVLVLQYAPAGNAPGEGPPWMTGQV